MLFKNKISMVATALFAVAVFGGSCATGVTKQGDLKNPLIGKWEGTWSGTGTSALLEIKEIKNEEAVCLYAGETVHARVSPGPNPTIRWQGSTGVNFEFKLVNSVLEGVGVRVVGKSIQMRTIQMKKIP
jgi:hypothetical protein